MTRKSPRQYPPRAAKPTAPASPLVRLQKVLAESGVASRRHSEAIIQEGRVSVDGQVVTELGTKVDPQKQKILVDGHSIAREHKAYFMVNKPEGYLSTNDDPAGRDRVIDLLPATKERLYPVGRLDEASQGLMLVTNDGPLANKLLHPRYGVPKVYRVQVAGHPSREALDSLRTGQEFSDGRFHIESHKLVKTHGDSTFLEIVLKEGHNREIRRLFARIGHKVLKLQRIAFGPLRLGKLEVGQFRHLTSFEVRQLKHVAAGQKAIGEVPVESTDSAAQKKRPKGPRSTTRKPRSQ
jgi:23S rRNA pseudouridine2605 synthase